MPSIFQYICRQLKQISNSCVLLSCSTKIVCGGQKHASADPSLSRIAASTAEMTFSRVCDFVISVSPRTIHSSLSCHVISALASYCSRGSGSSEISRKFVPLCSASSAALGNGGWRGTTGNQQNGRGDQKQAAHRSPRGVAVEFALATEPTQHRVSASSPRAGRRGRCPPAAFPCSSAA